MLISLSNLIQLTIYWHWRQKLNPVNRALQIVMCTRISWGSCWNSDSAGLERRLKCRLSNQCSFAWEGNGNPLQHSCLEKPMDGGACWAVVHGVANSWTRLSDCTFSFPFAWCCCCHCQDRTRSCEAVSLAGLTSHRTTAKPWLLGSIPKGCDCIGWHGRGGPILQTCS